MGGQKRRKRDVSSSSEDEEIDWAKEYLRLQKKTNKELQKTNEELKSALRENAEIAVKNKELESNMSLANTELLKLKESLSARGAIELFESQKFVTAPPFCTSRVQKYEWLFNNSRTFRDNVQKSLRVDTTAKEVGKLAKDLYGSASHDIHTSFNYGSDVVVRRSNYHRDHLKLLEAICKTLAVNIKLV